ncbi:YpmS family protein [Streptococcus macacae]|uniref:PF09911 family protein n=1 Tax=Streptococcus macacae NCTC 11558 TaxID=764298 RepID=G5JVW4_9STRE|nr:YpmS family protein [Streptococcus macacae]EHJ52302.1 hypothetical protein STRMA_1132 [Streptococcus macacae NCTC 11558]SUN78955.1 YfaA [Streptococcus macacae NCTC 11558]
MKQKRIGNNKNWWKWAFLLLLAINVAFWSVIAVKIVSGSHPKIEKIQADKNPIKVGSITTNKEQLNQVLTSYLNDYQSKKMQYSVRLNDTDIEFQSTYKLLGYNIPLHIYFEPYNLANGAIQLKVTSFSVGSLSLPESEILSYLRSSYKLPNFVEILPQKSVVNINLQKIDNQYGIYLKSTALNLVNDEISFDILKKNR